MPLPSASLTPAPSGLYPSTYPTGFGRRTLQRPPLGLMVEVEDASGRRFPWSGDERSSENRPLSVSFRTQRGDGYADCSLTLRRRIDRDYPDLNLFDTIRLIGADGSVAYEGRLTGNPRSLDDSGHSIQVEAVGWMSHTRDRAFREVYVDRDLSAWTTMSRDRRAAILGSSDHKQPVDGSVSPDVSTGLPCITQEIDGEWLANFEPSCETYYDAGSNLTIASLYYEWERSADATSTDWIWQVSTADSDSNADIVGGDAGGDLQAEPAATGAGTETFATPRRVVWLQFVYGATGAVTNPGTKYSVLWGPLAVFGNHGLTKQGTTPDQGYYASDVIENIVQRFCPRLSTDGVDDTTYVIGQIAFKSPTEPFDALIDLNSFHDWEMNVWEDRTLYYSTPTSLDDYDWEVRLDDEGTRVQLEGDSTDRLANGVIVTYTDLILGTTQTVTPDDDSSLADSSETNPANVHGIDKWITVEVPFPTLEADAVQWGIAALAQFNTPSSPGRITVRGHIRNRQGNWQQGWKVRCGERVVISDHPNDRARRITGTSWNHDTRTLEIEVEQDQRRLEVIAARIARARSAAGLG